MSTTRTPSRSLLAVALLPLVALLSSCSGEDSVAGGTPPTTAPTTAPTTPGPVPTTEPPAPATTAPAPAGSRAVAVYYLADTTNGPRLYREFHRRPATTAVVRDAITAMLTEPPQDADYTSLWPKGSAVRGISRTGSTLVVDLNQRASEGQAGAAFEGVSMQQLVWTATAADPTVKAVKLTVEGKATESLWGHTDTSAPMDREPFEIAPVWILTPTEGGTVKRGGTFGGEATVFEATVSWQLRQGGKVVKEGFSTATNGAPARGTWTGKADVPPGSYELRAFESSAEDGRETFVDTKRITVV